MKQALRMLPQHNHDRPEHLINRRKREIIYISHEIEEYILFSLKEYTDLLFCLWFKEIMVPIDHPLQT